MFHLKFTSPKLVPTWASGISNTVQMRILFEYSKICYKSIQSLLTSFGKFCQDLFYSRSNTRTISSIFQGYYKDGTIASCYPKIGKCSNQAFLSILIITSSQKEKEGKVSTLDLNVKFHLCHECYKIDTNLLSNYEK